MKQLLIAIALATVAIFGVEKAFAGDYDTSQHNFKVKFADFDFESRQTMNSDSDHVQLGYTMFNGKVNAQLRHTDRDDAETRARVTVDVLDMENFYLKQRIEWRHFQTADDYGRIRPIVGLKWNHVPSGIKLYTEYQASFNFGKDGEKNDFDLDSGQVKLGFDYRVNSALTMGPFIQWEHESDYKKSDVFLGTNITFSF